MPHVRIDVLEGLSAEARGALLRAVNDAMLEALKVKADNHPARIQEFKRENFLLPEGAGDRFTMIEASIFEGRSPATKRRLYDTLVRNLGRLGVPPNDIRIVLYEIPLLNWAMNGGKPACDIDLGFEVAI